MGLLVFTTLFYLVPAGVLIFFVVSLVNYFSAKRINKNTPGSFSPEQMASKKLRMAVAITIVATLLAVVLGLSILSQMILIGM